MHAPAPTGTQRRGWQGLVIAGSLIVPGPMLVALAQVPRNGQAALVFTMDPGLSVPMILAIAALTAGLLRAPALRAGVKLHAAVIIAVVILVAGLTLTNPALGLATLEFAVLLLAGWSAILLAAAGALTVSTRRLVAR